MEGREGEIPVKKGGCEKPLFIEDGDLCAERAGYRFDCSFIEIPASVS